MTDTAVATNEISNVSLLGSELKFLQIDDLKNLKTLDHYSAFYIRKNPSNSDIQQKITDLIDSDTEGNRYAQVNEPWVIFTDSEGNRFIVNGNTRFHALIRIINDTQYKDVDIQPIPYRDFLGEPSTENLIKYQRSVNDKTTRHTVLQLAETAQSYKDEREAFYTANGSGLREAQKLSSEDLVKVFDNRYSITYLNSIRSLSRSPDWLKDMINLNLIEIEAIATINKNLKVEGVNLTFEFVVNAIRQKMSLDNEVVLKNAHVKSFFKDYFELNNIDPNKKPGDDNGGTQVDNKPDKDKTEVKSRTKEELRDIIERTTVAISSIDDSVVTNPLKVNQSAKLGVSMLSTLGKLYSSLTLSQQTDSFNKIKELFLETLGDVDTVVTATAGDGDKIYSSYASLAKSTKNLIATETQLVEEVGTDESVAGDFETLIVTDDENDLVASVE